MSSAPGAQAALASVVKVLAAVPRCSRLVLSSGFVFAPHHVLMTAHGVAGAARDGVRVVTGHGVSYRATVVLFDSAHDIAVLDAPALSAAPLRFAGPVRSGAYGVIAGYPFGRSGPAATAVYVRGSAERAGTDMYGASVVRELLLTGAKISPGGSGGPLLDQGGQVEGIAYAANPGTHAAAYVLAVGQVRADAAAAATRTTPVSDHSCL